MFFALISVFKVLSILKGLLICAADRLRMQNSGCEELFMVSVLFTFSVIAKLMELLSLWVVNVY